MYNGKFQKVRHVAYNIMTLKYVLVFSCTWQWQRASHRIPWINLNCHDDQEDGEHRGDADRDAEQQVTQDGHEDHFNRNRKALHDGIESLQEDAGYNAKTHIIDDYGKDFWLKDGPFGFPKVVLEDVGPEQSEEEIPKDGVRVQVDILDPDVDVFLFALEEILGVDSSEEWHAGLHQQEDEAEREREIIKPRGFFLHRREVQMFYYATAREHDERKPL